MVDLLHLFLRWIYINRVFNKCLEACHQQDPDNTLLQAKINEYFDLDDSDSIGSGKEEGPYLLRFFGQKKKVFQNQECFPA